MLKRKKFWRRVLYALGGILLLLIIGAIDIVQVSKIDPPKIADSSSLQLQRTDHGNGFYTIKNDWFCHSQSGLYELYVEGDAFCDKAYHFQDSTRKTKQTPNLYFSVKYERETNFQISKTGFDSVST